MKNGFQKGFGMLEEKNGNYYRGEFLDNGRHNIGIMYFQQQNKYYVGHFHLNDYNGQMAMKLLSNNHEYVGNMKHGVKSGYGEFRFNGEKN